MVVVGERRPGVHSASRVQPRQTAQLVAPVQAERNKSGRNENAQLPKAGNED